MNNSALSQDQTIWGLRTHFLRRLREGKTDQIEWFSTLPPEEQAVVLLELNVNAHSEVAKLLPFATYEAAYTIALKHPPLTDRRALIAFIAQNFPVEGEELLHYAFNAAEDDPTCAEAATGLCQSDDGLKFIEAALRGNNEAQQRAAANGLARAAEPEGTPAITRLMEENLHHKYDQVRAACLWGIHRAGTSAPTLLRDGILDPSPTVRRQALRLMSHVDATIAGAAATLLEDEDPGIVAGILELINDRSTKIQPESLAAAITDILILRTSGRPAEYFNPQTVADVLRALFSRNIRLYGQTMKSLTAAAFAEDKATQRRAVSVARLLDEREFLAMVAERSEEDPGGAQQISNLLTGQLDSGIIANRISTTEPGDVQRNAANQIELLATYHSSGLQQAKVSFAWAIALSVTAFMLLVGLIAYLLMIGTDSITSIITGASTVLVQVLSATLFYIHNQARKQLTYYHRQMNQIQKYLLANSLAESLEPTAKEQARLAIIAAITAGGEQEDEDQSQLAAQGARR